MWKKNSRSDKVAVVGSRYFPHLRLVDRYMFILGPFTVVSGGARGVDQRAEKYATDNGWPEPVIFLPNWKLHGMKAGPIRNQKIIDASDFAMVFWDGTSRGTRHSLALAQAKKIPIMLVVIENGRIVVRLM